MKHAVIIGHPSPDSFTTTMAQTYCRAATRLGHEPVVRDLYRMGFDPCLRQQEIAGAQAPQPGDDVRAERSLLEDVDVFAFFYPLWFNQPPAIIKGYLDRVFSAGFGFAPGRGGNAPLLTGRRMISFSSSGAPEAWLQESGAWTAIRALVDNHVAQVCGLTVLDHIHFGGVHPGITLEAVGQCRRVVRNTVKRRF